MSDFIEHITVDGDRWDLLAWRYYGDATAYEAIIRANDAVPIVPILPGGVRLLIPVIDAPATPIPAPADLPPWV